MHEQSFKSAEIAPSLIITVAPGDKVNALVKFEFPNAMAQIKQHWVMDWTPGYDDLVATLEAAANHIRRMREAKQ